ncbi:FAD-dependent oxidoreductase [Chitinimonas sp.]|uniref:FAD-dependent oxidoreductase n=1 Tax=Chitinimonas sp. TaxID=1934313 RepID=UPI0035B4EBE6
MHSDTHHLDIAVIGGGTTGLSAAYYAAAAGHRTALFEQFDFYNDKGSSDGYSRMFRIMYSDANMARLAESAFGLWHEVQENLGIRLLRRNGLLFYGLPAATVEGDLSQCQQVMTELGIPFQHYDKAGLKDAYPVFREIPDQYIGLNQASSATIVVQESLRTFHDLAHAKGAALHARCPASISLPGAAGGPYQIDTPRGRFTADSLILAPGAWSNPVLAPFGLQLDLTIWQMTLAYYRVDPKLAWPMWYEFGPEVGGQQQLFYGFPPLERHDQIKVSADFTHTYYTDPSQCSYQPDPTILQEMNQFLEKRFRGIEPKPLEPATCLYTMSKDAQIVLDTLPGHPRVAVLTGESGRAFKYTPLFGRILVELARTGKSSYDIAEFSIKRPGIISG